MRDRSSNRLGSLSSSNFRLGSVAGRKAMVLALALIVLVVQGSSVSSLNVPLSRPVPKLASTPTANIQHRQSRSAAPSIPTISGFSGPEDVAYNPSNNLLYVANWGSNTVSVLNSTNIIVATIPVGVNPFGVVYAPSNSFVYVVNHASFTVSVINSTSNSVLMTVPVGGYPYSAEYNPVNNDVYVTNFFSGTVSVIDSKSNTVVATVTVGAGPVGVAYDPLNHDIYVANGFMGTTVSVINSMNVVVATINVGPTPAALAFDPANGHMYATLNNTVSVIDGKTNTVIATIGGFSGAAGVAFDPVNNNMYVTNERSNTTSVIDSKTNAIVATFKVGVLFQGPNGPGDKGVAFYPATGAMYVANMGSNTITLNGGYTVVDAAVIFPGFNQPYDVTYNPSNNYLYVTNWGSNSVSVLNSTCTCSNSIVTSIGVGVGPVGVVYDPANSFVYVVNHQSFTVSVINSTSNAVVATIPVGGNPYYAAFDPINNDIYVTNFFSNTVSVIDSKSNAVVTTIPLAANSGPTGVAFDPVNNDLYVTSHNSGNTVSVINGTRNTVTATINIGGTSGTGAGPYYAAFDPANRNIYVTNPGSNTTSVISSATNTVVATISLRGLRSAPVAAFEPIIDAMYVTIDGANSTAVINSRTNSIMAYFFVGPTPQGAGFYPATGYVYVTDFGSTTIAAVSSVFDFQMSNSGAMGVPQGGFDSNTINLSQVGAPTQPVTLSVSGLPTGASASFVGPCTGAPTCTASPPFSTMLTIITASSTPTGSFTITVTGTGAGQTHTTQFTLTVFWAWYPAGSQMETLNVSTFTSSSAMVNALLANQIDSEDSPLTATQQGSGSGDVNCASNTAVLCSAPVPDHGYFEIQFNLANILWGIPMRYGNTAAGVELRQGVAHLFNKQSFVTNNPACLSITCIPNDDAVPVCTTSGGCTNGGLLAANPCGWDTKYVETSTNCVVGAPGGTAYNCNYSTACPTGTVTGATTFPWQAAIGSPDFCAAAQHFISAFAGAGIAGVTTNASCELVAPTGGWPAVVTAVTPISCAISVASTANTCMFVSTTEPLKSLGDGIAQDVCALFSPAFVAGGWTTLAAQPFSCDNTNTGTANAACGGGACPFLQEVHGTLGQFCGLATSATGIPNNCWGIGTFGLGQVFPFDKTTYFQYNSLFATTTTVTCTNAACTTNVPGSPCASTVFSTSASDFDYICSPTYDTLSTAMEFSLCLASPGPSTDPAFNQASPTFASCSGTAVAGGAGATSCISASPVCSAVSAGYQALDYYGNHAFTIPVWTGVDVEARLSNWPLGGASSPGFINAIGGGYSPSASKWEWLNAYSARPAITGTFRQGFLTTIDSLNPFGFTTIWDAYLLSNVYDSLFIQNPECTSSASLAATAPVQQCSSILQNIDWMTTSHSFLCYPGGPACTSTTLGYGNSTYFASTTADLRLSLNRSNHWQDAGPVTAWDVKYSFINLNATGAFQATSLANVAHINVIDEFTLDLNLKAKGPFTELFIGGVTIIPGHIWSACGASTWNTGVTGKNIAGTTIVNAPEDTCVGMFGAPSIVTVGGIRADSPSFSLMANNFLIGSGPYLCSSIGGTGHPAVGTLGGGCSIDNTDTPASGLGVYILTRTGCTLTSTGTSCGAAGSGSDYFRSSGALAAYDWTGDIGLGSSDFSKVLTVNSCHSATPSANCPHWAQGIGNPGGTGANAVGLSQRLKVNSLRGISWIAFSTEKVVGTQQIFTCAAGYTLPGTTLTPCSRTNAGWTTSVLPGIGQYASTLHEVGSQITIGTTTTSTSTLSPASIAGCAAPVGAATAYPNGGYDC